MSSPSSVLVYFWHPSSCLAVVRDVRNLSLLLHPGTVFFFFYLELFGERRVWCVVFNESILRSCQFSTSHRLVVHHVWNSFSSIFSERFSVCGILSLYASVSPSSDAELSNSCLQLLQLYKLVGLCQLVPANLMASTWDLFTAISMQMNFESLKSRYHCLHIHNYSCALLRDLIIMFSLFCIYYYIFAFRSLYHPSISLFDDNNHDGKNDVEDN